MITRKPLFDICSHLQDLKGVIMNSDWQGFGKGISGFAKKIGVDRANLTKALNKKKTQDGRQNMSTGLYIKIMVGLELGDVSCYWSGLEEEMRSIETIPISAFFKINQSTLLQSAMVVPQL